MHTVPFHFILGYSDYRSDTCKLFFFVRHIFAARVLVLLSLGPSIGPIRFGHAIRLHEIILVCSDNHLPWEVVRLFDI